MSGFSAVRSKSPELEVVRVNLVPCVVEVAVTVASGTTAPLVSVTTPLISPLPESWALAGELQSTTVAVRRTRNPENTRMLEGPRLGVACLGISLGISLGILMDVIL
jgi:hypothetical protein